jgi:uncharacterized membrane protein YqiK
MLDSTLFLGAASGVVVVILFFLTSRYKKIRHEGQALIVNGTSGTRASLTGTFVWPVVSQAEYMDITRKKISVVRSGRKDQEGEEYEGLHCRDNIRADLKVDFYIGVNHEEEDIVRVAKLFTTDGASDPARLKEHFQPKFSEALKTAVKQFDFEELLTNRRAFRDAVVEVIGSEMDGFKIYDVVIDKVDQTALDAHDPQNVLDVEGIRKISAITAEKNIETNAIRQDEQTSVKKKDVEAEANRLQLDKQEKENEARVKREIDIIQAQEEALAEEKRQAYLRQSQVAGLETEEEVAKKRENVQMEIDLTRTANQRQVVIQQEELTRARETERVRTEKNVAQQEMEKETSIEEAQKAVVETRSQRVEIERKIAREEEETKNLRAFEEAERHKKVELLRASAEAEANGLRAVTEARAEKDATKERSELRLIENEAELKIRNREAENELNVKTRQAEGDFILRAKEAEAKERMAKATQEEISAAGLAEVEVERERANAIRETGDAEAFRTRATGEAEAEAMRAKGLAEAEAQTARFEAARQYDEQTRDHDKWVMQLQHDKELELARVDAHKEVAMDGAKALGTALASAEVKLFGGDGLEQLRRTIYESAAVDSRFHNSKVLKQLVGEYVDGSRSLPEDLRAVLEKSDVGSSDISNLAIAGLINKLSSDGQLLDQLKGRAVPASPTSRRSDGQ